jgi:hypothetical protein
LWVFLDTLKNGNCLTGDESWPEWRIYLLLTENSQGKPKFAVLSKIKDVEVKSTV